MGASITLAGESLIAQKHAVQLGLDVSRFIFANVPGLDPNGPVDRAAPKPAAGQIVHVYDIPDDNAGYVNPNQVVYSSQIGSDIGDWDFNWIGLETAEGVLFAVAYVPLQIKRRNIPPLQVGNNLTRNFLVAFDGAQALTGITIDASTWQHDFTVRLAGIDERERLSNRDVFGRSCFFGSSLQVEKVGSVYQVKPGTAYVEGIRLERSAVLPIVPPAFPTTAWLDVALQREMSDVVASWQVVFGAEKADYTDSAGVRHFCVAIADVTNANTLVDRRSVEAIGGPLVTHFAARNGDYEHLRARATTKEDVELENLPNAKSDDPETDSSVILATTKAVKFAIDFVLGKLVQATETMKGIAKVATQTQTNAGTDDTTFITPKKLRLGFSISLAPNGYIVFPTWLGGAIIQWMYTSNSNNLGSGYSRLPYPMAFPNACLAASKINLATGSGGYVTVDTSYTYLGNNAIDWIGYMNNNAVASNVATVGVIFFLIGH
jgi:hypothetical protein